MTSKHDLTERKENKDYSKKQKVETNNLLERLKEAINNDNVDDLQRAIDAGADPKEFFEETLLASENPDKINALHYAVLKRKEKVVEYLINNELVDVSVQTIDIGYTVLHLSLQNLKLLQFMIEKGAPIDQKNVFGRTPLHIAAYNGHIDFAKALINEGADVNKKDNESHTALHIAAYNGHIDVAKALINEGADVNEKDNKGCTALHIAAYNGHIKVVRELIALKADVNKAEDKGYTPLHAAITNNNIDVAKVLIEAGADVTKQANNRCTALHMAADKGHTQFIQVLIEAGAGVNEGEEKKDSPLSVAAYNGHIDFVRELIALKADVNKVGAGGYTPLHSAITNNNIDVAKVLIEAGADVSKQANNMFAALHLAANKGHTQFIQILIEAGANVNEKVQTGETPLYCAAKKGHTQFIQILIEAGAEPIDKNITQDKKVLSLLKAQEDVHKFVNGDLDAITTEDIEQFNTLRCIKSILASNNDLVRKFATLSPDQDNNPIAYKIVTILNQELFEFKGNENPHTYANSLFCLNKKANNLLWKLPKDVLKEVFKFTIGNELSCTRTFDSFDNAYKKLCDAFPHVQEMGLVGGDDMVN